MYETIYEDKPFGQSQVTLLRRYLETNNPNRATTQAQKKNKNKKKAKKHTVDWPA
jgi:hypothetical protein